MTHFINLFIPTVVKHITGSQPLLEHQSRIKYNHDSYQETATLLISASLSALFIPPTSDYFQLLKLGLILSSTVSNCSWELSYTQYQIPEGDQTYQTVNHNNYYGQLKLMIGQSFNLEPSKIQISHCRYYNVAR